MTDTVKFVKTDRQPVEAFIQFGMGEVKLRWFHEGTEYAMRMDESEMAGLVKVPHAIVPKVKKA